MASGTERRKRNRRLTARFNDQEADAIEAMADRTGQTVGSLLRQTLLNVPPPRRSLRRPQVEVQAVARLLGELGKIGSNINQLAKYSNMGRWQEGSIQSALRDLAELRLACLQALGHEPTRRTPDPEE